MPDGAPTSDDESTICIDCGQRVLFTDDFCKACGARQPSLPPRASDDVPEGAIRWLVPVGRSGWAIAAGWCGFFSLFLVFGPIAVILGLVALRDLKKRPRKMGKGRAWFGIVCGSIATCVLVVIVVVRFLAK